MKKNLPLFKLLFYFILSIIFSSFFQSQNSSKQLRNPIYNTYTCILKNANGVEVNGFQKESTFYSASICDDLYGELSYLEATDNFLSEKVWIVTRITKRGDFGGHQVINGDASFENVQNHPQMMNICYEQNSLLIGNEEYKEIFVGSWSLIRKKSYCLIIGFHNPMINSLPEYLKGSNYIYKYIKPKNIDTADAVIQIIGKEKNEVYNIELKELI